MRTSSQLDRQGRCEFNPHSKLRDSSRTATLAGAQRSVAKRVLKGEPIPDIAGEIDSILTEKGFVWENLEQRFENEDIYEKRIRRFAEHIEDLKATGVELVFPDELPEVSDEETMARLSGAAPQGSEAYADVLSTIHSEERPCAPQQVVDYFGEPVKANPDFFLVYPHHVEVCRLTTSRFQKYDKSDVNNPEMCALGLCGRAAFPGKQVYVSKMHLAGPSATEEADLALAPNGRFAKPYGDDPNVVSQVEFSDAQVQVYAEQNQERDTSACTPEECAACPNKNICHYEEPPISIDVEAAVRPIDQIRLTSSQAEVVNFDHGTARVDAGPGGGKTLVLAMRIAKLREKGVLPEEICLLTYTKAGAEEMTARAMSYAAFAGVPLDPEKFSSGTFHSFCKEIVDEYYEDLGYTAPPRIVPNAKRARIVNDLINTFPRISGWKYSARSDTKWGKSAVQTAVEVFSAIKKESSTRENYTDNAELMKNIGRMSHAEVDAVFTMYEEYQRRLKAQNLCEFDDLIAGVDTLYEMHQDLFERMGFKHILVDEFQDTDLPQIRILQKMVDTTCFESFMAVGDDSQSIFGFRHTSPEFLINFDSYFGRYQDFKLTENHRSDRNIVDFANAINDRALEKVAKELVPTKLAEVRPTVQGYYSSKQEHDAIADDIAHRWAAGERDIAVIMPTNAELDAMASALTQRGIPSVVMSNTPYSRNSRVSALESFYSAFMGQSDQGFADYQNIVNRGSLKGMNASEIEAVADDFKERMDPIPRTLESFMEFARALDENGTDDCYQDFLEQLDFCKTTEELQEFWEEFKLYGQDEGYKREGRYEGVALNTIHSSKGLEWDTTYLSLTKLDSTSFHTSARRFVNSGQHDETIRKFFVGATRARKNLIMTGEYVLKMDRQGATFNDYVRMAYETLGKPYDYNYANYRAVQDAEKAQIRHAASVTAQRRVGADPRVRAAVAAHALQQMEPEFA